MNNEGPWFLIGMGSFLIMQICYIQAFRSLKIYKGPKPSVIAFYATIYVVLNYLITPKLPADLQIPILIYTAFLATMTSYSGFLTPYLALGGFVFFISDTMIGVGMAKIPIPYSREIVITTYLYA